jgi:putative protein-disulfide isomerase
MVKIHYFFDPLCGWCFGATALVDVIKDMPQVELILHPGGMLARQQMSDAFRAKVKIYDPEIASLTGQAFGQAYSDRVQSNAPIVLDSFVTAQAVMVMEQLNGSGVDMLKAIQSGHYQQGLDVSNKDILTALAKELGIKGELYQSAIKNVGNKIDEQITTSRQLMGQWGVQGFPTLIAATENGIKLLPHTSFYNSVDQWKMKLHHWFL